MEILLKCKQKYLIKIYSIQVKTESVEMCCIATVKFNIMTSPDHLSVPQ